MKRYIRSSNIGSIADAKSIRKQIIATLEGDGFSDIRLEIARKQGMSGAGFSFYYQYDEPDSEWFLGGFSDKYGEEKGRGRLASEEAAYDNFEAIKNLTQFNSVPEDAPGGFLEMDDALLKYVRSIAKSMRSDAIVTMNRSGLQGVETRIQINIFVPNEVN